MPYSRDQIVTKAFRRLGKVEEGQAPSAETMVVGREAYDGLLKKLASPGLDVLYVSDPEAVEDAFFLDLSDALALALLSDYPSQDVALPSVDVVYRSLRVLGRSMETDEPVRANYF